MAVFYSHQTVVVYQEQVRGDDVISNTELRPCSGGAVLRFLHENRTYQNL
jgi:hypothetical protein